MKKRKHPRLQGYDYAGNGGYFVTFCTRNREELLSRIRVGPDALIGPLLELTAYGQLVEDAIAGAIEAYPNVDIPEYVIMPNHVHLMVTIEGPMGASGPTLGMIVRSIKTRVSRACGQSIWQEKFYDHIVRDDIDYLEICTYIQNNPARWIEDKYYTAQES
jgi:REP element-mobilizing transposase RayT